MVYRVRQPVEVDGVAVQVPVENGSLTDLTARLRQPVTAEQINHAFATAGSDSPLAGILRYTEAPLVSRDIIGDPHSCVFDTALTQADGNLVKVFGWYDNEWATPNTSSTSPPSSRVGEPCAA